MKHSRRPICVHRSAVRRARQGRFITGAVRSCRSAFVRPCNAVCRRFAARRRGFAERKDVFAVCRDFRRFRKVVLRALAPARPVRRALFPVRSAPDTGLRHTAGPAGGPALRSFWPAPEALAGMRLLGAQHRQPVLFARDVVSARGRGKMCSSGAALRENRKKDSPLVTAGGISAAGRSAAFALALGGFVYWPESTSASRQPSRLPMRKAGKKAFPPVRGPLRDGCGRLTEVYGIRVPAADMVCGAL